MSLLMPAQDHASYVLSHLSQLEAESIHIMREVAAEFERPVMLYSGGKDSSVLLRLAQKAFHPGAIPFPMLHVDTTLKFGEMYAFRDAAVAEAGARLEVYVNRPAVEAGINPFGVGTQRCCGLLKTQALLSALQAGGYDAAIGGARREEEKSRAKERVYSFRDRFGQWDPKNQRPELWNLYNGRINKGESIRVFPLSNWTELDVWQYISRERIAICPLYFAREREVVERDGQLIMLDGHIPLAAGEKPKKVLCRFRTLGCYPCTGAVVRGNRRTNRGGGDAGAAVGADHARDRPRCRRLDGGEEEGGVFLGVPSDREEPLVSFEL